MELASTRVEEQVRRNGRGGGRDGKEVLPFGLVLMSIGVDVCRVGRRGPLPPASAEETLPLSTFLPPSADDFWVFFVLFLFFVVYEAGLNHHLRH